MVDFVALRATAKRLIDANSRPVTITRLGNNPSTDDQKPWRSDNRPVIASVTGGATFVADKARGGVVWSLAREVVDGMKTDNSVALFAAANDNGENLEEFDEITDGSTVWRILRTELLQPAADRILYVFEVARK